MTILQKYICDMKANPDPNNIFHQAERKKGETENFRSATRRSSEGEETLDEGGEEETEGPSRGIMVVNKPLKRVKRFVADYYPFTTFAKNDSALPGPFRSNIRCFLSSYAEGPVPVRPGVQEWRIRLRLDSNRSDEDGSVPSANGLFVDLNIFEERVKHSFNPYCDHCRVVTGWYLNPVCKRRYHFIIPAESKDSASFNQAVESWSQPCVLCGAFAGSSESYRCKACRFKMSKYSDTDDESDTFEDPKHLLHGVFHANGFGHLLRVNGREGGSRFLTGCDIMDLWDRICLMLKVRKVSVMDVSKKYGLEYRLLHAVQNGHPWYGSWGYEFSMGSFGITYKSYKEALEWLSKLPLSTLMIEANHKYDKDFRRIISFYCNLSRNNVVTVRDIICYLMDLLHGCNQSGEVPDDILNKNESEYLNPALTKWGDDEIHKAMLDLHKVLRIADRGTWVSWHDLKGAVCYGRSPQLVDYVLRHLAGQKIGTDIVQCHCVPLERTWEFRLTEEGAEPDTSTLRSGPFKLTKGIILEDLKTTLNSLISPLYHDGSQKYGLSKLCADAAQKILDCKQFIKNYDAKRILPTDNATIKVLVTAEILKDPIVSANPPTELLILPQSATVGDLKQEAEVAFKDVYTCFKRYKAENIVEIQGVKDTINVMLLLGADSTLTIQGRCKGDISKFRTEKGIQTWVVDCPCGTREDDGERMVACDTCEVWQHTRCVGIDDSANVPTEYLCRKCKIVEKSSETGLDSDHFGSEYSLLDQSMLDDSSFSN